MTRATAIHIDLLDLKGPWVALCESRGVKPSEAIRALVKNALDGQPGQLAVQPVKRLMPVDGEEEKTRIRLTVQLSESEQAGIKVRALHEGYTPSRWVASLIRAALSETPQFSARETEMLSRSNSNLLAIGRNLNQAVRNLHVAPNEREKFRVDRIEALADEIRDHVKTVSALVTANIKRWRLE